MRSPLFVRLYGRGRFRSLLSTCLLLILVVICPLANASSDEIAFDVSGSFRVRYESLNNPIFPTSSAAREQSNQRLSTRFIVNSTVSYQNLAATIEIRDSRVFLDENDPTLTANQVNTLEPTQFFITYKPERASDLYEVSAVKVGRMELDYGSRRLLAKTAYRNATNSYDGIVWKQELQIGKYTAFTCCRYLAFLLTVKVWTGTNARSTKALANENSLVCTLRQKTTTSSCKATG